MKILILGGYGVFGGRLANLLADEARIEMLICGRSQERAAAFCAGFRGQATVRPLQLDRAGIAGALAAERPDLVVDASGPFQAYGENPYGVIEACVAAGTDYLDFADAADFVFGVSRFDEVAKAAGIFVMAGASSFPVLTAAVLREMSRTMQIVSVAGGIAPSPYAGIGLNVMRAVLGYAGEPVKLRRGGVETTGRGLAESRRHTIAVPGHLPLRNIRFSLVDVPDLQVIPPEYDSLRDIWMGAGPVPESLHRILNLLAKSRAALPLPSLVPFAGVFYTVLNIARWGEHRGGMFVEAKGLRDGNEAVQTWHLLAEGDDGPFIPSMTIEAIIRKLLEGIRPQPGARAATHALELADYAPLFEGRRIYTSLCEPAPPADPLFRQVLGPAFDRLPAPVRALHDGTRPRLWTGRASVRRGTGWMARAIAALFRFPPPADEVPVSVHLTPGPEGEVWVRDFGGRTFRSVLRPGTAKNDRLIVERFGKVDVALALVVDGDRLYLIPRRWSCLGIPLPRFLLPSGDSFETQQDGRFCFDVRISAPLIGLIVAYAGTLEALSDSPVTGRPADGPVLSPGIQPAE